ncbi:MAG: GNAT family N-acetyltransferase [Caldilineaceae bacterium]|nr:GNAT family N-acetyltransferase [Caldilineaceae bacterium]
MSSIELEQLDQSAEAQQRLLAILRVLDANYIPPVSSRQNLEIYCCKLIEHANLILAKVSGKDIGLVAIYTNDNLNSVAFISSIGVLPAWQGQGVGSILLTHSIRIARERGMRAVRLEVSHKNTVALGLYQKAGFVITQSGNEQNADGLLILEKDLTDYERYAASAKCMLHNL